MLEIRWHGRGGQGAITAAKIFATAAFKSGYTGVVMAPTFGTERRGAPVFTSLKLAKEKIYDISPIETPDMVVVLDHLLLTEADVTGGPQARRADSAQHAQAARGLRLRRHAPGGGRRHGPGRGGGTAARRGELAASSGSVCRALDLVPFDLVRRRDRG